ncbi:phage tail protein [Lacticaseibacillus casei]|uniref:Phage tail protein n=1 Tax=Lacticaseibacillus casei DSM 20011 = JCM 1134 = ATCC 393 TaxID=1423732 RepID=A0AAD1ESF4_LACCA|nr:distal tail protein Dit [Lacticaseibacillus casei]BAN73835.1 phage tail protein [Lacticaseibacillus casei DSM 20011 = JCM 1134 = ATCC 393]MBI6598880.1 phage tail family protein [Lacticaseibacillus casei]MED7631985.1 phage tail protein [Lacticaseibacillus casei]PTU90427.1 phage tail protein [Lacticaseibacillus casei]QPC16121.1 phage tail family protein [Lacticaseibacillus casei]
MKQAGMTITYAGVDITQWMYVQMVKRDVGTNHINTMQKVGISDGQMLKYMSRDVKTIVVTGIVMNDNLVPLRRSFAAAIDADEPQQLIFGDEPDKYYLAIVDSQPTFTEGFRSGTISISFICPDGGIAHSVATKTFDNMPYNDLPVNMLVDSGFESGKTPANHVWGDGKDTNDRMLQVIGQAPSFPTPFGNYMLEIANWSTDSSTIPDQYVQIPLSEPVYIKKGETWTYSYYYATAGSAVGQASDYLLTTEPDPLTELSMGHDARDASGGQTTWHRFVKTWTADRDVTVTTLRFGFTKTSASAGWVCIDNVKLAQEPTVSPWSPNPADPEYYTNTITVHNGGTYPVEPVITATMHADNGFLGFANSQGGVLQFGNPEEIDGYTSEESEVALNLAAVQGSHMDNQAASNNLYWGDNPATPNEQIGNAIWTEDRFDGWKVEPNWPSITGAHKYWNGPSIKHNLAQTHNGNFKSNLTWDVMARFQTNAYEVGTLETTLESDGKPIFQMMLKDNSSLSDQIWWICYYKNQLVVYEQLDRNIFTNDKFIQLELQKFGNSVVFRVSPWVGNRGRETTITRQFTFADAASVETKQFSAWFMRDKTWGESTMYLIASIVKWQNVSWYTDIKNRFSNGDVITVDVANTKTYFNGSEDRTLHTLGNLDVS